MMSKRKKGFSVALFGGSFNPPHEGHRAIIRRVVARKGIDELWVLPVFKHPFRKKLAPFSRRLCLCRSFFAGLGRKVKIGDLEKKLGGTSRTFRLVSFLKKRYPGYRFSLVLGGDAYRQRRSWRGFDRIRKEVRLVVFPRGPRSPIPDVSSTEIRKGRRRR